MKETEGSLGIRGTEGTKEYEGYKRLKGHNDE